MKLTLVRRWFSPNKTIGKLLIDGVFRYYVLEDLVRPDGVKVYGKTAIPYGQYKVSLSQSPKLGRELPLIENVPGFSGIRIHAGIDESWTEGCVLISRKLTGGKLELDRPAEKELNDIIRTALQKNDPVSITITSYLKTALTSFGIFLTALLICYFTFITFF